MSNIQTGAERMPHDLSHLGFLAGQIGRLITISTTPVIAGDSFEMDAVGALRLSPLRRGLAIDSTVDIFTFYVPHRHVYGEQWIKFMKDGVNATPLPTVNTTGYIENQAVATSQEAVQNQNEPQLRDENAHNDKSVHGVLNPTYQAGLRRDAVQPDIEAERKKRDEIEAGKSYCSRRFGGATCDDKSAQIYARFDKNDWRIQPAEFYRFHDAEVNTFGYF